MKQGDFSTLAKHYHNRPGYSLDVIKMLAFHVGAQSTDKFQIADVGAGTGKLTENLCECGLRCVAVEPNDEMREEGRKYTEQWGIEWYKGSGENATLPTSSVNWVLMGSSFHWVDLEKGLAEFHRILKPSGCFTALWSPRDIEKNELHLAIEKAIYDIAPGIERKSSGGSKYTEDLDLKLVSTGHFKDPIFMEASYTIQMPRDRYLGAWRSVNDIQAQAGPEKFEKMMQAIEKILGDRKEIGVPYKTRAWTVRRA